jgi:hypothetical protein
MRWYKVLSALVFLIPFGSLYAAPGDSIPILNDDTTRTTYNTYSVCDTERNPVTGDSACLSDAQSHCDTGSVLNGTYINYDYTLINGYAGFKIDWDAGTSRFNTPGFDTLVLYHKGPGAGLTVTVNFGSSAFCGMPTTFSLVGTFTTSNTWTREAFPLSTSLQGIGLYEMQVLINGAAGSTASGNLKIDNMVFIKKAIKTSASAPLPVSPADSAVNQPRQLNLAWSRVTLATSYGVEVSTSADFTTDIFVDTGITTFSNTVFYQTGLASPAVTVTGLKANAPYFWRANASNSDGTSPWGAEWSFVTGTSTGVTTPTPKKSGCGSGFAVAFIAPFWIKAMSMRRRRKQKQVAKSV